MGNGNELSQVMPENLTKKVKGQGKKLRSSVGRNILTKGISLFLLIALPFAAGLMTGKLRGVPFIMTRGEYSIGIYVGDSPFDLKPHSEAVNPVLTARDVTDITADFVADPFLIQENGNWYMFFEIFNSSTDQGDIGLAVSTDGKNWEYDRVVLDESFHLSYPYVFQWEGDYYMIPESKEAFSVSLYKAEQFPYAWKQVRTLFKGNFSDPSLIHYKDHWWIFVAERNDILRLFYSGSLEGDWTEHPHSPVVLHNLRKARPSGRVIDLKDTLVRFTQDCEKAYGEKVNAFIITELTPETYKEEPWEGNPFLKGSGKGWNAQEMHHVDLHRTGKKRWMASVDGWRRSTRIHFGY